MKYLSEVMAASEERTLKRTTDTLSEVCKLHPQ
jgi:hypothetical protein